MAKKNIFLMLSESCLRRNFSWIRRRRLILFAWWIASLLLMIYWLICLYLSRSSLFLFCWILSLLSWFAISRNWTILAENGFSGILFFFKIHIFFDGNQSGKWWNEKQIDAIYTPILSPIFFQNRNWSDADYCGNCSRAIRRIFPCFSALSKRRWASSFLA